MITHKLKVHPQFWMPLVEGKKLFELRRNDRNFKVADYVDLRRYDPSSIGFTGEGLSRQITYVLHPEDCPGLEPGYVILGLSND